MEVYIQGAAKKRRPLINSRTPLDDVPRVWLKYIEPKIDRDIHHPCWIWTGAKSTDGYPVVNWYNPVTKKRTNQYVHIIVAEMFWEDVRKFYVKRECRQRDCVNPNHFVVDGNHFSQDGKGSG